MKIQKLSFKKYKNIELLKNIIKINNKQIINNPFLFLKSNNNTTHIIKTNITIFI